ncbi:hypothetical protein [Mycobacterium riyadhense]|nr:hypothetical protein [Mycobacterium riyadhense]
MTQARKTIARFGCATVLGMSFGAAAPRTVAAAFYDLNWESPAW